MFSASAENNLGIYSKFDRAKTSNTTPAVASGDFFSGILKALTK